MREKRQHKRIDCRIPCHFVLRACGMKDIELMGLIRNISGGGAFLELPFEDVYVLDLKAPVKLEFTMELNDENMYLQPEADIVRADKKGLGVKFKDLPDDVQDRITDYNGN